MSGNDNNEFNRIVVSMSNSAMLRLGSEPNVTGPDFSTYYCEEESETNVDLHLAGDKIHKKTLMIFSSQRKKERRGRVCDSTHDSETRPIC